MTLRFRRLRLQANTGAGVFGASLDFQKGLNVLWADNTKGKSTCLQGILYALGLERMLSPRREIPLTYIMTAYVKDPLTGESHPILESSVSVEVENASGKVITVRRAVVSSADTKLVSVLDGPALTQPESHYTQKDYFVLDPGAALREAGFHRMLADFIGWNLPSVRRFDGTETKLYLEALFPLLYVEQKAGWSAIPAAFPTWFQIRDVSRRSVEFLLNLKTHDLELLRQQLELDLASSRISWSGKVAEIQTTSRAISAMVQGLPPAPTVDLDAISRSHLVIPEAAVLRPLDAVIAETRTKLESLRESEVPTVQEATANDHGELERLLELVAERNLERSTLFRQKQDAVAQGASVNRRLAALEEDLQKNLDAQKLQRLGSSIAPTLVAHHCPTCDQPISDSLMAQRAGPEIMPIDDNIEYIRAQRGMFLRLKTQAEASLAEIAPRLTAATAEVHEATARIRAIRADLVAPSQSPSVAALEERIRLESRVGKLEQAQQTFEEQKAALSEIAERHARIMDEKERLPADRFTPADRQRIQKLAELIRSQVQEYGFSTFPVKDLDISDQSYRPEKAGFEIGFELSASDAIRLKWAYQLALMELARTETTNHPGFVIFDEPRQQEAAKISFKALLQRASAALAAGQQVIFATSEERDQLDPLLADIPHNLIAFDGPIVTRL